VNRAVEAKRRIDDALQSGGALAVSLHERAEGTIVQLDGAMVFAITPGDTLEGTLPAAQTEAQRAAAVLRQAIEESRESRDLKSLLRALGVALLATAVAAGLLWGAARFRRRIEDWIVGQTLAHADRLRVGGVELVKREGVLRFERLALNSFFWVLVLLLLYEWLSLTLGQFPFTRAWGEQLNDFLIGLLGRFVLAILRAVPDLIAAALIFWHACCAASSPRWPPARCSWPGWAPTWRSRPRGCAWRRSGCSHWPWPTRICRVRTPRPSGAYRCWSG
jgi:hypothetical protein